MAKANRAGKSGKSPPAMIRRLIELPARLGVRLPSGTKTAKSITKAQNAR